MATTRRATIVCDLALVAPEVAAVDVIARWQLCAKRSGREVRWQGASRELRELIDFMGLSEALPQRPKEGA